MDAYSIIDSSLKEAQRHRSNSGTACLGKMLPGS